MVGQYLVSSKAAGRLGIGPLLAGLLAGSTAFATVDDDEEPVEAIQEQAAAGFWAPQLQRAGNLIVQSEHITDQFTRKVTARLRQLDRACHLTDVQKQKLILAAAGDGQRHRDALETLRTRCSELQPNDFIRCAHLVQEIKLWQQQTDPFVSGSLFEKTLHRLLAPGQRSKLHDLPSREGYEQLVSGQLPTLGARIGLRQDQYAELVELLTWETDPPKKYGRFEYMYLVYQISQLPADKLRPLLDERQQARLAQQYVDGAEALLIQIGMIDEPAAALDPARLLPADDESAAEPPIGPREESK
jgi:hypothetical protein